MPTTALILLGHGSHISPNTAGMVWEQVDRLRARGVADEITAAFWKEPPAFHHVLNTIAAAEVTLVPLFTAAGYFTRTVIPAEMHLPAAPLHPHQAAAPLNSPLQAWRGAGGEVKRHLHYTPPIGQHPHLATLLRTRVEAMLHAHHLPPHQTALALIGHGTRRNPESRQATEMQATTLRAANLVAEVVAVFLDDSPAIADVYHLTHRPHLLAIPYFLALGSHTSHDIPAALGLAPGQTVATLHGRTVYYGHPVGIMDNLTDLILDLAQAARRDMAPGAGGYGDSPRPRGFGSGWAHFPTIGQAELSTAVHNAGRLVFGELLLTPHEVRPLADAPRTDLPAIDTPGQLRTRVRENPFRPLPTARGLPGGWHVSIPAAEPARLAAVVETVYPGVLAAWALQQRGTLTTTALEALAARQTGMYRDVGRLTAHQRAQLVTAVCGDCSLHPLWHDERLPADRLPCAEACNRWLSRALERG